ncbi:ArgD protein [[Mannheimia] succiniciproducens MBEL55E]|uniref:ArgD protein n=2 Tax=Basfia TaxID=697331 RepID=Q65UH0_MANSM|nr:ArgD protein [[Mannheimia] succiniciproducens MBEL55E]
MILVAGPNVLRFAPALNISQQEVAEGFKRLDQALQKFA